MVVAESPKDEEGDYSVSQGDPMASAAEVELLPLPRCHLSELFPAPDVCIGKHETISSSRDLSFIP